MGHIKKKNGTYSYAMENYTAFKKEGKGLEMLKGETP